MHLHGYARNGGDGVHIYINGTEQQARQLLQMIRQSLPAQAQIIASGIYRSEQVEYDDFSILVRDDEPQQKKAVLVSPDVAICPDCLRELHDPNNRRYRYPFITCTHCGPRYSIIQQLPYERMNTTMQPFIPCKDCREEYENPLDRRFYSQTNSCPHCPIHLYILDMENKMKKAESEGVLKLIHTWLEQNKILALKGIGGYHLICDANSPHTIQLLRNRKHRPSKPFALLYPNLEMAEQDFFVSEKEKELLTARTAPIVLLAPKLNAHTRLATADIAPGLQRQGIMLPYSPLLELVATDYSKPLVATSGNIAGSPIIYKDEEAWSLLSPIADHIIGYDRDIVLPEDDSVAQVSTYSSQTIFLRRSRGYAPTFTSYQPKKSKTVLAAGAQLKSSFSLSVNGNVFVSQFLGSGDSYESQQMYRDTLNHWLQLYQARPKLVLADLHPDYFTHQYARQLAQQFKAELQLVQHHEAHFAAVLAENDLLDSHEPVLGVIWDGTGLGTDGNTWGGEFFTYHHGEIKRSFHLDYIPAIAGDKMAMEPRIAACCATFNLGTGLDILQAKFSELEWKNYQSLCSTTRRYSSSAGRLFDAVASLAGICDRQSYEGEAALGLQVLAENFVSKNGFDDVHSYINNADISTATIMAGVINDIKKGKEKSLVAARFHCSLAQMIGIVANYIDAGAVCFSGGVFQNSLLVDWIRRLHEPSRRLYFHRQLSPNDENISFGQLVYYDHALVSAHEDHSAYEQKRIEEMINF